MAWSSAAGSSPYQHCYIARTPWRNIYVSTIDKSLIFDLASATIPVNTVADWPIGGVGRNQSEFGRFPGDPPDAVWPSASSCHRVGGSGRGSRWRGPRCAGRRRAGRVAAARIIAAWPSATLIGTYELLPSNSAPPSPPHPTARDEHGAGPPPRRRAHALLAMAALPARAPGTLPATAAPAALRATATPAALRAAATPAAALRSTERQRPHRSTCQNDRENREYHYSKTQYFHREGHHLSFRRP